MWVDDFQWQSEKGTDDQARGVVGGAVGCVEKLEKQMEELEKKKSGN
jgi:hypothetical protein